MEWLRTLCLEVESLDGIDEMGLQDITNLLFLNSRFEGGLTPGHDVWIYDVDIFRDQFLYILAQH